ncbi:hypothetical protein M0534_13490 [Methylonatrum kenyense]|uniref:hypothetical protein n=1 Tax=Methylonatrum kenyense TaxID=455253 RepID=UPI0020BE5573|nr:hypothetical protein [Methylonatrum kenyense]MCK8517329.1 hypothetical protein [Methylonatrum kenyense]
MRSLLRRLLSFRSRRGAEPVGHAGLRSEDPDQRRRVVRHLCQPAPLLHVWRHDPEPRVRDAAGDRLRTLLVGGAPGMSLTERETLLAECDDPTLVAHVARRGREPEIRLAAVRLASGQRLLSEIIQEDADPAVRDAAKARLADD